MNRWFHSSLYKDFFRLGYTLINSYVWAQLIFALVALVVVITGAYIALPARMRRPWKRSKAKKSHKA